MKAIIFGVNSQDGFYLSQILLKNNIEVVGVSRSIGNWIQGDVSDINLVSNLIKVNKPQYVFHLAANSSTSYSTLFENQETICKGVINILDTVKQHSPKAKVFITGSGVQFKNEGNPIKETDEFEGNSPYSICRIQSVYAARYFRGLGVDVYVGYLFHHESPYRKATHISKLTTNFIKTLSKNPNNQLELGDIDVKKEWTFAMDIAEGIFTLVNQTNCYEACIGSGKVYSIKEWLECCFNVIGLSYQGFIKTKDGFKPEYNILVSNPTTINALGWQAKTSLNELAKIMMSE